MLPNDKTVTVRYQLISDMIVVRPYIEPLENESAWDKDKYWITDDPYHLAMGKLSELGQSNIIKMNALQVNSLFDYVYGRIMIQWQRYQQAREDYRIRKLNNPDRRTGIGMRLGMVARVDKPLFIPNFHCKFSHTIEFDKRMPNGECAIRFHRYIDDRKPIRYARMPSKPYYEVTDVVIDVTGNMIVIDTYNEFGNR